MISSDCLKTLPAKPGVYIFKDDRGRIIYVGKAACLSSRVQAYFGQSSVLSPKHQKLVASIHDVETIVTDSEQEALILECNLIKKYRPIYNVRLKDDKSFPYLKVDLRDEWPTVRVTRRFDRDGSTYFGPFASAGSLRATLRLLKKIFPFRSCSKRITQNESRPCLEYHIKRCLGPCIGAVNREQYAEVIRQVIMFLEGKQELVARDIKKNMEEASKRLEFERAAMLRDQLKAIEKVIEGQRIAFAVRGDYDAIGMAQTKDLAYVVVFFVRNDKLIGRDYFLLDGIYDEGAGQIMASFVKQFYSSATSIPPLILLQCPADEPEILTEWLSHVRGGSVRLTVPQRGAKRQLMDVVAENARQGLLEYQAKKSAMVQAPLVLEELKDRLRLPGIPVRIEGYDVSNIRGKLAVGSMVVFEHGFPKPAHYRRFRLKLTDQVDDYAMLREVLTRRFKRYLADGEKWSMTPDLILIDGGKGHLNAALEVMHDLGIEHIPIASLAKGNEELYIPGNPEPVDMPKTSAALHLLERVRDEAHRFALGYHRRLRHKEGLASVLDAVPGIGSKRKKALLLKFGSVERIKEASVDELAAVRGMNYKVAQKLKEYL